MHKLEKISEQIHQTFDAQTAARDKALAQARMLTHACALAIRAVHRDETEVMQRRLNEARVLAGDLRDELVNHPDLYYAGYTQDALKEYAEANITCALLRHQPLPTPEELAVTHFTYLNGLAESVGEMRRRSLDMLRQGNSTEAELLLGHMDEIYSVLVTMDYPDAITYGLRRQTDVARSIIERTRGDITFSLRSEELSRNISRLSSQFPNGEKLIEAGQILPPLPEEE